MKHLIVYKTSLSSLSSSSQVAFVLSVVTLYWILSHHSCSWHVECVGWHHSDVAPGSISGKTLFKLGAVLFWQSQYTCQLLYLLGGKRGRLVFRLHVIKKLQTSTFHPEQFTIPQAQRMALNDSKLDEICKPLQLFSCLLVTHQLDSLFTTRLIRALMIKRNEEQQTFYQQSYMGFARTQKNQKSL